MKFYGYFRSSAAYRCRIAFNLKQVAVEHVFIHLRRGEQREAAYRAVNPQALVPSLEVDGRALTQSLAIIEWLEETHPEPPLLPADPIARAQMRAFALAIAADLHPINNLRVLQYLKHDLNQTQDTIDGWYRHWIGVGLEACEALLARRHRHLPFAFGERPGLADLCLVPQLWNARRYGCDLAAFPKLVAIDAACAALPAFAAAAPERQPDFEP